MNISGREVPIDRTVRPIKASETLNALAIFLAYSTIMFALSHTHINEIIRLPGNQWLGARST